MKNKIAGSLFASIVFSSASSTLYAGTMFTSPSWPKIENNRSFNVLAFGDFLYWRFSSPNLTYGRDGVNTTFTGAQITTTGRSNYPVFNYKPGFRAGLGIKFGPEKVFDIIGMYTHLHSKPFGSTSGPFSGSFIPLNWFSGPTTNNTFNFGSLSLNLLFRWIEVQSGYTFNINQYYALRPYFALTSYLVSGSLNATYGFTNTTGSFTSQTFEQVSTQSIGPKVGLDIIIHLTEHFGLFTNVCMAQQISRVKISVTESVFNNMSGSVFIAQLGRIKEEGNFALTALEIGPTFDTWFDNYKYRLQLRVTFSASNLISGTNLTFLNSNNQDLLVVSAFHGFLIRAMVEY